MSLSTTNWTVGATILVIAVLGAVYANNNSTPEKAVEYKYSDGDLVQVTLTNQVGMVVNHSEYRGSGKPAYAVRLPDDSIVIYDEFEIGSKFTGDITTLYQAQ